MIESLAYCDLSCSPNFSLEDVRCGLDKEIAPDGTYQAYFPFGAMIERPQIASYREKFSGLISFTRNCLLTVPR